KFKARYCHDDLAAGRDPPKRIEDHAANGIDFFRVFATTEIAADHLRHLVDFCPGIDHENALADLLDQRLVLVVLVLDIPNDHLDNILKRDETIRPAILVNDQRHLNPA